MRKVRQTDRQTDGQKERKNGRKEERTDRMEGRRKERTADRQERKKRRREGNILVCSDGKMGGKSAITFLPGLFTKSLNNLNQLTMFKIIF